MAIPRAELDGYVETRVFGCLPGIATPDAEALASLTLVVNDASAAGAPIDMVERLDTATFWPSKLNREEATSKRLGLAGDSIETSAERLTIESLKLQGWPVQAARVRSTSTYAVIVSELSQRQKFEPLHERAREAARAIAKSRLAGRLTDNPLLVQPQIVCPA